MFPCLLSTPPFLALGLLFPTARTVKPAVSNGHLTERFFLNSLILRLFLLYLFQQISNQLQMVPTTPESGQAVFSESTSDPASQITRP